MTFLTRLLLHAIDRAAERSPRCRPGDSVYEDWCALGAQLYAAYNREEIYTSNRFRSRRVRQAIPKVPS
jgi:hypothetical protein